MPYPIKDNFKRGDMIKTITAKWLNWVGGFFNDTKWEGVTFTTSTSGKGCKIRVNVDDVTTELASGTLLLTVKDGGITTVKIADLGVTTAKIAVDAVDKTKIAADVAGAGIAQNGDGSLEINPDGTSLELSGDTIQVKALGIDTAEIAANAVTSAKTTGAGTTFVSGVPGTVLTFVNGLLTTVA